MKDSEQQDIQKARLPYLIDRSILIDITIAFLFAGWIAAAMLSCAITATRTDNFVYWIAIFSVALLLAVLAVCLPKSGAPRVPFSRRIARVALLFLIMMSLFIIASHLGLLSYADRSNEQAAESKAQWVVCGIRNALYEHHNANGEYPPSIDNILTDMKVFSSYWDYSPFREPELFGSYYSVQYKAIENRSKYLLIARPVSNNLLWIRTMSDTDGIDASFDGITWYKASHAIRKKWGF